MKTILFILFLLFSAIGFAQEFDYIYVGNSEIGKIYEGNTLIWEKSGCEYGNLDEYVIREIFWNTVSFDDCSTIYINSLQSAKDAIDDIRTPSCNFDAGLSGIAGWTKNGVMSNEFTLQSISGSVACEGLSNGWKIYSYNDNFDDGANDTILYIDDARMTLIQIY